MIRLAVLDCSGTLCVFCSGGAKILNIKCELCQGELSCAFSATIPVSVSLYSYLQLMEPFCSTRRINTLSPLRNRFWSTSLTADWMRLAKCRPNAHMPLRNAKAGLRNSWKPAAEKAGRFCDHRITKSGGPAREIIGLLVMCRLCPAFLAVGFLEFLRFVSAFLNGICAFGRPAAIPLFRAPPPMF